jgi:quinoprotein glucose dehydrogenase
VPASDVPGEKLSPTQPFPTKPPAYARNYLKVPEDLIDFTPELRAQALERLKRYKYEPSPFAPPILGNANGPLYGALVASTATNWPGSGADPETHVVYAQAGNMAVSARSQVAPPKGFSDIGYVSGIAGQEFREVMGPGDCCAADAPPRPPQQTPLPPPAAAPADGGPSAGLNVQGLPMVKPPYGTLAAINLDRGDLMWQVPHGDTPDNIRTHPLLAGKNIPKTGQPGTQGVGLLVTKTLVVMGDPQITAPPGRQRGAMLRAYDKQTGQEVGAVWLPAPQSGSPMTYSVDGKQFIVVAIGGGAYSGEYLAFALPGSGNR